MTTAPDPGSFRIVGYGDRAWNPAISGPIDPMTEAEARARHEAGEAYAVLLTAAADRLDLPLATVTLNQNGVTVGFHRHDVGRSDQAHMWQPGRDGSGAEHRRGSAITEESGGNYVRFGLTIDAAGERAQFDDNHQDHLTRLSARKPGPERQA